MAQDEKIEELESELIDKEYELKKIKREHQLLYDLCSDILHACKLEAEKNKKINNLLEYIKKYCIDNKLNLER